MLNNFVKWTLNDYRILKDVYEFFKSFRNVCITYWYFSDDTTCLVVDDMQHDNFVRQKMTIEFSRMFVNSLNLEMFALHIGT